MNKEKVKSIEDTFVPLSTFEEEEVKKLIALQVAYINNQWFGEEYVSMQRKILYASGRFNRVSRCRKSKSEEDKMLMFYAGYEEAEDWLIYIQCNNGMILYFNNKAELVART